MQARGNITETGVNFTDSLTAYDIYKINYGTKQPIRNHPGKTEITERLQAVITDLVGSMTPVVHGKYRFMAKFSDHYTKFKVVYFISMKHKALTTLAKFAQDLFVPLGLRFLHLRSGSEFIADYYCDYCKITAIIQ